MKFRLTNSVHCEDGPVIYILESTMALCMGQVFHRKFIRSHCWELYGNIRCLLFVLELIGEGPELVTAALPGASWSLLKSGLVQWAVRKKAVPGRSESGLVGKPGPEWAQ